MFKDDCRMCFVILINDDCLLLFMTFLLIVVSKK